MKRWPHWAQRVQRYPRESNLHSGRSEKKTLLSKVPCDSFFHYKITAGDRTHAAASLRKKRR